MRLCTFELDDFDGSKLQMKYLRGMKADNPSFCATAFTILGNSHLDDLRAAARLPWLDVAVHALSHKHNHESAWPFPVMDAFLSLVDTCHFFTKIIKFPWCEMPGNPVIGALYSHHYSVRTQHPEQVPILQKHGIRVVSPPPHIQPLWTHPSKLPLYRIPRDCQFVPISEFCQ